MRRALATAAATFAVAAIAAADGGLVRLSERAGPFTITVFTAPTPLRAGPIDVSVLVQDADGGRVVGDAAVSVTLRTVEPRPATVTGTATRAQATNKLLYAALLELPSPGRWQVDVSVERAGTAAAAVSLAVDVAPPLPPWRAYWPYFALPAIGIAVYALHQWLVLHRR